MEDKIKCSEESNTYTEKNVDKTAKSRSRAADNYQCFDRFLQDMYGGRDE